MESKEQQKDIIMEFLDVCTSILTAQETMTFIVKNINSERIQNYREYLSKTGFDTHRQLFLSGFMQYKSLILAGSDLWIQQNTVSINFGDGTKADSRDRIYLNAIYKIALDCVAHYKELFNKQFKADSKLKVVDMYPNVNLPTMFLYRLYRVYNECLKGELEGTVLSADNTKLLAILRKYEATLGLTPAPTTAAANPLGDTFNSTINNLQQTAANLMKNNGLNTEGITVPSSQDIKTMINALLDNETVKNIIDNAHQKGGASLEQTMSSFISALSNGDFMKNMAQNMAQHKKPEEKTAATTSTESKSLIEYD